MEQAKSSGFTTIYSPLNPNVEIEDDDSEEEDDQQRLSTHNLLNNLASQDEVDKINGENNATANVGTKFSSFINLTNTIIGAGMLGLPYAFSKSGWILGSFLLCLGAVTTVFSLHILSICAHRMPRPSSFFAVTNATVPKLTFLIDVAVFAQTFGAGCAYLIVIGGLMPEVMDQSGASIAVQSRILWIMIGFGIVSPLSFFDDLTKLNFTSILAVIFAAFFIVMVFLYTVPSVSGLYACNDSDCSGKTENLIFSVDVLRVFSIFIFAYACQINMFPVVNELRRPSIKRFNFVIKWSIFTSSVIYLIVAVCGYKTFGNNVMSNILINYPNNIWTSTCRVSISFLVAFSYPLQVLPARASLLALWRRLDKKNIDGSLVDLSEKSIKFRYYLCTILFLGGSVGVALSLNDLGILFSLVGATGATTVVYILPGISYYEMFKNSSSSPKWKTYGALALFIFGLIIMPITCIFIFI